MDDFFDSPIDDIINEEHWECSLRHKMTKRYKLGVNASRTMKVRQILGNIERNLNKKGPYPLDRVRTFIENYEMYPEVRPYAEKVLPKIIEGGSVRPQRLNAYNILKRKIKEIQR